MNRRQNDRGPFDKSRTSSVATYFNGPGPLTLLRMDYVYLDNAEATKPDPDVLEEVSVYQEEWYGVPSSDYGHTYDLEALEAVEEGRDRVASAIGADGDQVVFTSGAVESNNLAVKGVARRAGGGHLVVSEIEHSSVLDSASRLESDGFEVTEVEVDVDGLVDPDDVDDAIGEETALVSIGHANNEIGVIQDVEAIGEVCEDREVLFHTDASASFTKTELDVDEAKADLVSLTGGLIHGPKGVGALYVRNDRKLEPILDGDDEEYGLRPGAVNVPGVVGFGVAAERGVETDYSGTRELRDLLIDGVREVERTSVNGSVESRLPTNVNATFFDIEGESILLHLDMRGVAVSTGSACYSKKLAPSHVLSAIGLSPEVSHGSIRFSLSKYTTKEEVEYTLDQLDDVVDRLREISAMGEKRKVPEGR